MLVCDHKIAGDGVADDWPVLQRVVDKTYAAGGGKVRLPAGTFLLSQTLIMRSLVKLEGECWHSFGGPGTGTVLKPKAGVDMDLIRFAPQPPEYAAGSWISCGISDMTLMGHPKSTGHGIALLDAKGGRVKLQDLSTLERLCIIGFSKDGIYFEGGSPINITNVATVFNGGVGIRFANPSPATGYDKEIQSVSLMNISGDGNRGGASIRFENIGADYAHALTGIKSEQRDSNGAISQPNVIQFHNCAHDVDIRGLQHISSGANTTKPGDAILITGKASPRIAGSATKVRALPTQAGAEPMILRDVVSGQVVQRDAPVSWTYQRAA